MIQHKKIERRDNLVILPDHYQIFAIDYSKEPEAKRTCIDKEHRHGVCPDGHKHGSQTLDVGENTVTNQLKTSVVDQATGTGSPVNLLVTQVACGTSSTPTDPITHQQPITEYFRTAPTDVIKTSATQFTVFWYYNTTEANAGIDLQEWCIMAGGATGTAGTGKMIARFLQQFTKTAVKTVSGQYDFTIA